MANEANLSDFPCSYEEINKILEGNSNILIGDLRHTFDVEIRWDLENVVLDCADWISAENLKPESNSRVWIFSSLKAEILLSTFLGGNLSKAVRVLVETSSILHNWGINASYLRYSSSDLWRIRSFAGSQVLHGLEHALKNANLAKASVDVLKALFLALLGTIIAVGYLTSIPHSDEVGRSLTSTFAPADSNQWVETESPHMTANAFEDAQKELLRTLTHHMILVAERSHVMSDQKANSLIVEKAYCNWSQKAIFRWETVSLNLHEDLKEDYHSLAHHFSSQGLRKLESMGIGTSGLYPPQLIERTPILSLDALSDLKALDSCDTNNVNDETLPSHCVFCASILDFSGVCSQCLPLNHDICIDGDPKHIGDPLNGPEFSGYETSANIDGIDQFGYQWNLSNPLQESIQSTVGVGTASEGKDLHALCIDYSGLSWDPEAESEPRPRTLETSPGFASPASAFDQSLFRKDLQIERNDCDGQDTQLASVTGLDDREPRNQLQRRTSSAAIAGEPQKQSRRRINNTAIARKPQKKSRRRANGAAIAREMPEMFTCISCGSTQLRRVATEEVSMEG